MPAPQVNREVRADLTCRQCGYNLRGMTRDRSCPECGTPVEFSARWFQLRFADPAWVRTMRSGTNTMLWSAVVFALSLTIGVFAGVSGGGGGSVAILLIGWAASVAMWCVGVLRVTTVEPRVRDEEPPVSVRRTARATVVVAALSWIVVPVFNVDLHRIAGEWGVYLPLMLSVASLVVLLRHMRRLADRSLSGHLRDWITSYLYTAGIAAMLLGAMFILGAASSDFGCCAGCLAVVAVVFFSVWLVLLLAEFNRELDHCVRYAESEMSR